MNTLDAYKVGKKIRAKGWSVRMAAAELGTSTATAGRAVQVFDMVSAAPIRLHETLLDLTLTRAVALARLTPALACEALGGALDGNRDLLIKRVRKLAKTKNGTRPRAAAGTRKVQPT